MLLDEARWPDICMLHTRRRYPAIQSTDASGGDRRGRPVRWAWPCPSRADDTLLGGSPRSSARDAAWQNGLSTSVDCQIDWRFACRSICSSGVSRGLCGLQGQPDRCACLVMIKICQATSRWTDDFGVGQRFRVVARNMQRMSLLTTCTSWTMQAASKKRESFERKRHSRTRSAARQEIGAEAVRARLGCPTGLPAAKGAQAETPSLAPPNS